MMKLLVHSAQQVVTITSTSKTCLRGEEMRNVEIIEHQEGTSIAVDSNGLIAAVGSDSEIAARYKDVQFQRKYDARGYCVMPGFIDTHTHPVWAGDRVNEFAMKLSGASYMDVHKSGGGIYFTVDQTKRASDEELLNDLVFRINNMMCAGSTTVECKSGYGLDTESEMRLLRIIEEAKKLVLIELVSTYCGAHAIPKDVSAAEATQQIISEQIPELKRLMDQKVLSVENIDVFCEKGVFDAEQSRSILLAGQKIGLSANFHGDELNHTASAEMGAEIGARAISHLEEISPAGISAMAAARDCMAILLPTTAYVMRLKPPPARALIEAGVPVALGSDFNPNAYCLAMPMVMNLACVTLNLSMAEALVASTLNAAAALGRGHSHGSIQPGKVADLVIIRAPRWEHLIYQFGLHNYLIVAVVKTGNIISEKLTGSPYYITK